MRAGQRYDANWTVKESQRPAPWEAGYVQHFSAGIEK